VVAHIAFAMTGARLAAIETGTPQPLAVGDTYRLDIDGFTNGAVEGTTEPKTDANDGQNGDNPYFQRTNITAAHVGPGGNYWYTRERATQPGEADPCGPQWIDYRPPLNILGPGLYQIDAMYRYTASRANYAVPYIVTRGDGSSVTINKFQNSPTGGDANGYVAFNLGTFDLGSIGWVRVDDPGCDSITFHRMKFTLLAPPGGIPYVSAGFDQTIALPDSVSLIGVANDDGLPNPLTTTWTQLSGPGTAAFANAGAPSTTASFSAAGTYVLRLTAYDGLNTITDDVTIIALPAGSTLTYSTQYEFDDPTNPDPSTSTGVIDASSGDANGTGLLIKLGTGTGNAGSGIAGGILHYIDSSSSGNHGYYFQNGGSSISYTVDMAVRVNGGVSGTTNRRSMGFSAGNGKNLGLRLHKINDGGNSSCLTGSMRFAAGGGGTGTEACTDFSTPDFHRIRVAVDALTNSFRVYDLDNQIELTSASGGGGGSLSWAAEINNLGGFHIGSISGSNTTSTDYELDYFRVLLGLAVQDATKTILPIGLCHDPFADADGDHDVDLNDFGAFQTCYTGNTGTIVDLACRCFDHNGDNHINEMDFNAFNACANTSRSEVLADVLCDGP